MKRLSLLLVLLLVVTATWAQRVVVTGQVLDTKSGNAVSYATAALLRTDSTAVTATTTDDDGRFSIQAPAPGPYVLKISYVGFDTFTQRIQVKGGAEADTLKLGTLNMHADDNLLGTATVTAAAARVEQKADTTMFNASAYRVPEGSTLEALIKQLPGVEVGDDGSIKWNGKTVSEFLVNGKDFFKGNTETAMKNLPTELVNKIKAYDKKSDYAEQTGIDDGEETTVLDISTKRELNQSWVANADLGYGNHDRYSGRLFATRFTDNSRVTAYGAANNTNDQGFGGPRGFGGGGGGLVANKNAGIDFDWGNGKKRFTAGYFEVGGNVRYSHTNSDVLTTSNSQMFLSSGSTQSFDNSWSHSVNKNTSVNSDFRLEWSPDSFTTITFRPSYNYNQTWNSGNSRSVTFSSSPYDLPGMASPLDSIFAENAAQRYPELYALMVNANNRLSLGNSHSHNVTGSLNITRRLNDRGRNVSLQAVAGYTKAESNSFSISSITYNTTSGQAPSFLNQYSNTPTKNYNYSVRLGYVEPLGRNWYAEARYQYSYKYSDSNRSRYNLDSLSYEPYSSLFPEYSTYGDPNGYPAIGSLPTRDDVLNYVRDLNNSQYATYKYYDHTATIGVRYNTKAIRFSAGVDFNPEKTRMAYNRPGQNIDTLITRNVFKMSPQVRFRYRFSQTNQLEIRYRGTSAQPSMTNLLAVVDDADPLNISMGNPGLKPSWVNTLRANYNAYNPTRQQGMMLGINMTQTSNSISNRMVYDQQTGVRYTRPENINGNWNGRAMLMFNSALGAKKLFNISTFTALSYDNAVGYVSLMQGSSSHLPALSSLMARTPVALAATTDRTYASYSQIFNNASSQKNTTRTLGIDENLNASYRASWFDVGLLGRINYQHARASVQENSKMDTWNFAYGANANFNFDFGLSISTDIRMNSRRGYTDNSMNTNELLWNAQIAQSFLKSRALTLSVQFYDILQQQSSISRSYSSTQRTDTWTNAINSYFMVHVIYKLSIFSGGNKQEGDRPGPPDMRGPGGMPMRGGFGGPGGGPGRRPF